MGNDASKQKSREEAPPGDLKQLKLKNKKNLSKSSKHGKKLKDKEKRTKDSKSSKNSSKTGNAPTVQVLKNIEPGGTGGVGNAGNGAAYSPRSSNPDPEAMHYSSRFDKDPPARHEFHQTIKKGVLHPVKHEGSDLIPMIVAKRKQIEMVSGDPHNNFLESPRAADRGAYHNLDASEMHCMEMLKLIDQLRDKGELCDTVFICEDKSEIKVHGAILAGCSKWYKEKIDNIDKDIKENKGRLGASSKNYSSGGTDDKISIAEKHFQIKRSKGGVTKLRVPSYYNRATVDEFCYFCYHGQFKQIAQPNTTIKSICDVLQMCLQLKFEKGKQESSQILMKKMTARDFMMVYRLLTVFPIPEMSNSLWQRALAEFDKFLGSSEIFKELSKDDMQTLCGKFKVYVDEDSQVKDEQLLSALILWVNAEGGSIGSSSATTPTDEERQKLKAEKIGAATAMIKASVNFSNCSKPYLATQKVPLEKIGFDDNLMSQFNVALEKAESDPNALEAIKKTAATAAYRSNSIAQSADAKNASNSYDKNLHGFFMISGGRLFDSFNAMVFRLDLNDGKWREVIRLPNGALAHHSTALTRTHGRENAYNYYVIGGQQGAHIGSLPANTCSSGNSVPSGPASAGCHQLVCNYDTENRVLNTFWRAMPELQHSRSHATLSVLGSNLFIVGGRSSQTIRSTCEILDLDSGQKNWKFTAPLKTARHSHAATVFGDTVYICGGISARGELLNDILSIQPVNTQAGQMVQWQTLEPMQIPRANHSMLLACTDRVIVIGGTIPGAGAPADTISGQLGPASDPEKDPQNSSYAHKITKEDESKIFAYSPVCNKWYTLPSQNSESLKKTRSKYQLALEKNKKRQKDHHLPNMRLPDYLPGCSELAESASVNFCENRLMIIGGWDAGRKGKFNHSNKVWLYDAQTGIWDLAGGLSLRLRAASGSSIFSQHK